VEAFTRISNEDIDLKKGRGVRLANLIVQESRHDSMFSRNELRLQLFLVAFMLVYYGALITHGSFNFLQPEVFGLTFNSMLEHLLHGQFDVDPEAVGGEGYLREGRVYAYWGIFCAVIRLPVLAFKGGPMTDVTRLSCLIAVCFAGVMKLRAAVFVRRYCQPGPVSEWAFALLAVYIVLGGAQVGYLRAILYQEVVFWAAALGAAFVYCAVKGIILARFTPGLLSWMALFAGLALQTRVSMGLGLYAATGFLLLALIIDAAVRNESVSRRSLAGRLLTATLSRQVLFPIAILVGFLVATGLVNFSRWGNPTKFADFSLYLMNEFNPDRLSRMYTYGLFNIARIPFSLGYFFVPVWMFEGTDGKLLFDAEQTRLFDAFEFPPSSFFLTDLLPIVFIVFLAASILRPQSSRPISLVQLLALAVGLAVPCVLTLTAIYAAYRYRMDFYPEIDLLAFLGFFAATSSAGALAILHRYRGWITAATVVSIVSAHGMLFLYSFSLGGPAQPYLHDWWCRHSRSTGLCPNNDTRAGRGGGKAGAPIANVETGGRPGRREAAFGSGPNPPQPHASPLAHSDF
jgi:hypothetical protein